MAFGLNAAATFQRLPHLPTLSVSNCNLCLGDVVVYSHLWTEYVSKASLTLNLVAGCQTGVWAKCVFFFFFKFKHHQLNCSTREKETLAMLLALQHFQVYASSSQSLVIVYAEHNPLVFLAQIYNHSQCLFCGALLVAYSNPVTHRCRSWDCLFNLWINIVFVTTPTFSFSVLLLLLV